MQSRITIVNRKFCLLRSAFFFQSISDRVIRVLQLFLFLFFFSVRNMMGNAEVFQVATSQWIYQLLVRHDAMKIIRLKGVTKYSAQIAC